MDDRYASRTDDDTARQIELSFVKQRLITVVIILALLLTAQLVSAQNGKLKIRGVIENVSPDVQTLVSLYEIPQDVDEPALLGQYIIQGNDWFKTVMHYDKTYMLELSATNGITKRFVFFTEAPQYHAAVEKMDMIVDLKKLSDNWQVLAAGTVAYSKSDQAFVREGSEGVDQQLFAMNPQ